MKQARCALSQPFLWVNRYGDRFYNESLGSIFSDVYNAMTANGGSMWSIFDDAMETVHDREGAVDALQCHRCSGTEDDGSR